MDRLELASVEPWGYLRAVVTRHGPKTRIIVVRHGETEWNVLGRLQGQADSPLTPRGRSQARRVGEALRNVGLDALYTSDLPRAAETARIILDARSSPRCALGLDVRLREIGYGLFEGLTWGEIRAAHPALGDALERRVPNVAPPGGESRLELQRRMGEALRELAERHAEGTILVVTHGGALGAFLRLVLDIPLERPTAFRALNCAINRFDFEAGAFELVTWGETAHLDDEAGMRIT